MPKDKHKSGIESVNIFTGEIIETYEQAIDALEYLKSQKDSSNEVIKANIADIKKKFNIDDKELVVQKKFFTKLYKGVYNDLIYKLNPYTCKVLFFLIDNMDYRDNSVSINGKYPSHDDMVEKSGVSDKPFKRAIKELVDSNVIKSERHRTTRRIYINPSIVEDSKTEKKIHNKFQNKDKKVKKGSN